MAATFSAVAAGAQVTIRTMDGVVAGSETDARSDGVRVFKGIPYAAPPVGDLRWQPPAPARPWRGTLSTKAYRPDCATAPGPGPASVTPRSEDCLYLNVFAPPAAAKGTQYPVMVWIFGSGFQSGSAAQPTFDGTTLARKGVVVVTVGFRTGVFGYLTLPGLSAASPHHVSGNYGVLDAIAALKWTKANIAKFGGDPGRVTIFGQSSGSETVNILTASPLARRLFQRAIGESGASIAQREAKSLATSEKLGVEFANRLGTADPAKLRAMTPEQIYAAQPPRFEPVIDGWMLPASMHAIYTAGRQNDVAMMLGSNGDEAQRNATTTAASFAKGMRDRYGPRADTIVAHFPATDATAPDVAKRIGTLLGDFSAAGVAWRAIATGHAPVYRYRFEHAPPSPDGTPSRGAFHGAEIPYVFGSLDGEDRPWTATDRALADTMSSYWANFARTGDPNGPGLPRWQPVRAAPGQLLQVRDTPQMAPAPNDDDVLFLDRFFYGSDGVYTAPH